MHTRPVWLLWLLAAACQLWTTSARAVVDGEPGSCAPPCREGFFCKQGRCVSLCNPPCRAGERCVDGECELMPRKDRGEPRRTSYFGVFGLFHAALNDSASHLGEVRIELGGKYTALELGPAFGDGEIHLRSALRGHVPLQPFDGLPLYLVPTVGLGYAFGWIDDGNDGKTHDFFIVPGLRVRYDVARRFSLMLDLIQIQVNFVRLYGSSQADVARADAVPVTWNLGLGVVFTY